MENVEMVIVQVFASMLNEEPDGFEAFPGSWQLKALWFAGISQGPC